jgi:EAL domain-containing protein (putative c-di-GMP-specific phosphodiesterase class I)
MHTVAEGVETKDQLAFVREAGCDEAQGYLFSPPLLPVDYAWFAGRGSVLL